MKRHCMLIKALMTIAALFLFSSQGWATPILLPDPGQPSNGGDGTIQAWLIASINLYNSTHNPDLPTSPVGPHPDIKVNTGDTAPTGYPSFGANTLSIALPGNLNDYLVLHWGGPGGGVYQAFELISFPEVSDTFNAPSQNGLSSYAFYGSDSVGQAPVPEPTAMLLLGSGLIGLWGFLKKFKK